MPQRCQKAYRSLNQIYKNPSEDKPINKDEFKQILSHRVKNESNEFLTQMAISLTEGNLDSSL